MFLYALLLNLRFYWAVKFSIQCLFYRLSFSILLSKMSSDPFGFKFKFGGEVHAPAFQSVFYWFICRVCTHLPEDYLIASWAIRHLVFPFFRAVMIGKEYIVSWRNLNCAWWWLRILTYFFLSHFEHSLKVEPSIDYWYCYFNL